MSRRSRAQRWLAGGLVLAAAAVVTATGSGAVESTLATWQRAHFATATLTSGTLNSVASVTCGGSGGLLSGSIPIVWTAPATGVAPTGYVIVWGGTAGAGSSVSAGTGAIPGSGLSVLGQSIVTVYATSGSWNSPMSVMSLKVTTISVAGLIVGWGCAPNVP